MKKLIVFISLCVALSGCSLFQVHRMDVDQGNIYNADQVAKLQKGLTIGQVKVIMGSPVLINIFTPNRVEYIYTFREGNDSTTIKRVTCHFSNGVLVGVQHT